MVILSIYGNKSSHLPYPGNEAVPGCGLQPNETSFDNFVLQLLYDPSSKTARQAKARFLAGLISVTTERGVHVSVGKDRPDAWLDRTSTALSGEQSLLVDATGFAALVPWAVTHRPAEGVDFRLIPLSLAGGKCRHGDYVSRAMYAGSHWEINEAPLQNNATGFLPLGAAPTDHPAQGATSAAPAGEPQGFLLYMMAVNDNGYQMYSAGLDTYKAGMAQLFTKRFPEALNCTLSAAELRAKPVRGSELCQLGVSLLPFDDGRDPMLQSYSHVYVPTTRLAEVVSWAMDTHTAARVYYDVDLRLVPLTGNLERDYRQFALKTGPDWRLNGDALAQRVGF